MEALKSILHASSALHGLKGKNINDPKICMEYIRQMIELEKGIEAFEYEKAVQAASENDKIAGLLDELMVGTDPKELTKFLNLFAEELKKAVKSVGEGKLQDFFDPDSKKGDVAQKEFLNKMFHELNAIQESVEGARQKASEDAEKAGKEHTKLDTMDALEMLKKFMRLMNEIRIDFDRLYKLKELLKAHYEYLLGNENLFTIHEHDHEIRAAFDQLAVHMKKVDAQVENKMAHMADTFRDTLHAIDHMQRHTTLTKKLDWAFKGGVFNLRKAMEDEFAKRGWDHEDIQSLEINYKKPWKTFEEEIKDLEFELGPVKDIIIRLCQLVVKEYEHKCDSPYHGIEHVSQVFITSVRIFKGAYKELDLGPFDFFILCASAILHDTGYLVEKFKFVSPGYLSSMNHTFHEDKSWNVGKGYLEHYKKEIVSAIGEQNWDIFMESTHVVISATKLFAPSLDAEKVKNLQKIIMSADLLEMCSENYIDYLVPLYIENKIGNVQGPWPANVHELLKGTPFFMTQLQPITSRVDPMMKYLGDYPQYEHNRTAVAKNVELYMKALEGAEAEIHKIKEMAGKAEKAVEDGVPIRSVEGQDEMRKVS